MIPYSAYAKHLRKAKEKLLADGWIQDQFENDEGSVCTIGAINYSVSGSPNFLRSESLDVARFMASTLDATFGLAIWNDDPDRKQAEVVQAFENAEKTALDRAADSR